MRKINIFYLLFILLASFFTSSPSSVYAENLLISIEEAYCLSLPIAVNWKSDALPFYFLNSNSDERLYSNSWNVWFASQGSFGRVLKVSFENGKVNSFNEVLVFRTGNQFPILKSGEEVVNQLRSISGYKNVVIKAAEFIAFESESEPESWWYWGIHTDRGVVSVKAGRLGSVYDCAQQKLPQQFWSEIKNISIGWLNLRKTAGTQNKSVDDIIKTLPNGWAIKVASTTDDNGNFIDIDGYRWYQVEDKTDGAIGWMAAENLTDGTVYLDYNPNNQAELQNKAETQLDTADKRKPIILDAVNNYHTKDNSDNSLYGGGGGLNGNNNFQRFIQGSNFPKELTLAITVQEFGPNFDNEICSQTKDGGIGIMQITSPLFKGLGSGLDNKLKKNDCDAKTGWVGDLSKYYSNALQGIYANIKDGFRVFQEKYRQKCPKESIFIDGYEFTCQDIEKILTVWGYNGFAKDKETGLYTGNYLKYISDKLKNLNAYFASIIYNNTDYLIEKLQIANNNKQVIRLYSPGELQVIDSENRITGLVNGVVKEDIPNSLYDKDIKGAAIFFPNNVNKYRVIGIDNGLYSLSIDYTKVGLPKIFRADNIPITTGEIHEYIIDWDALFNDEIGATIKFDQNGDGTTDKTFISGDTFNQTDIFLKNNTIIDFEPDTLNVESNGITTAYIELPTSYSVNDISTSSIRLNKVVRALSRPIEIGDYDKDGIPDLMVKFAREEIKPVVATGEEVPITIIGKVLYNGNYYYFKGQDVIKIINNNKSEIALNSTVSRWAWAQKIFNDLEEKMIAVFYKILQ